MIKNRISAFCIFVVFFLLFWNVLDYLFTTFFTRGIYIFGAGSDFVLPVVVAIVLGYLFFSEIKSIRSNLAFFYKISDPPYTRYTADLFNDL